MTAILERGGRIGNARPTPSPFISQGSPTDIFTAPEEPMVSLTRMLSCTSMKIEMFIVKIQITRPN